MAQHARQLTLLNRNQIIRLVLKVLIGDPELMRAKGQAPVDYAISQTCKAVSLGMVFAGLTLMAAMSLVTAPPGLRGILTLVVMLVVYQLSEFLYPGRIEFLIALSLNVLVAAMAGMMSVAKGISSQDMLTYVLPQIIVYPLLVLTVGYLLVHILESIGKALERRYSRKAPKLPRSATLRYFEEMDLLTSAEARRRRLLLYAPALFSLLWAVILMAGVVGVMRDPNAGAFLVMIITALLIVPVGLWTDKRVRALHASVCARMNIDPNTGMAISEGQP